MVTCIVRHYEPHAYRTIVELNEQKRTRLISNISSSLLCGKSLGWTGMMVLREAKPLNNVEATSVLSLSQTYKPHLRTAGRSLSIPSHFFSRSIRSYPILLTLKCIAMDDSHGLKWLTRSCGTQDQCLRIDGSYFIDLVHSLNSRNPACACVEEVQQRYVSVTICVCSLSPETF
jgi:hypothetical protein